MVSAAFPNRPFNLREKVWVAKQEVANNRSQIAYELWVDKTGPSPTFSSGRANRYMKLNGTIVSNVNESGFDFQGAGPWRIISSTTWINHNSDGTLSVSIEGAADYDILGAVTVTSSLAVATIARASTATFSGGNTLTAGTAVTINTNRADSTFTHKITYEFGSATGTISTNAGASVSWTPALSMLTAIPSATSAAGTITTTTYKSGVQIGAPIKTGFVLNAPASVVPTIDPLTGLDTNSTVASVVGAYVQDLSRLKVGVTAAGVYGSTITETSVTVDGVTGSPSSSYALPTAGTRSISAKVVDSRGRTATRSGTVPVLAYSPPSVSSVNVRRATSGGTVGEEQSHIRVDLNATVKSLVNGSERNGMTIKVRTRPTNGAWTNRNTITGALTYNTNFVVSGGAVFPPTSSFDVEITVTDKVGKSWTRVITLATSAVTLDMVGTNVGVGKYWEQGALDVGGDIFQNGNKVLDATNVATATARGIVELATNTEAQAGTDASRAITPAALASVTATETRDGLVERATQAEVNAGTDTTRYISPKTLRDSSNLPYKMAAGQVGTSSSAYVTVTLPTGFTQAPRVVADGGDQTNVGVSRIISKTSTSFQISIWTLGGAMVAGTNVQWIAVQMTASSASG